MRVRREDAEVVLAELLELAPSGVEQVDLGDLVEYAVYGAPGELPVLPDLRAAAGEALVEIATSEVGDDWAERWREFHVPLVIGDVLSVRPPWERPGRTRLDVVIDPGRAFGTGAHATTRLCLELMLDLPARGGLTDLGCGSGVLAIVGAKLGFAPVTALDNDRLALEATAANAEANRVEVAVVGADLRRERVALAETVVANLLGPLLCSWARALSEEPAARRPSVVIAGGLLEEEADAVVEEFAPLGLRERERRFSGGWAALLLGA